MNKIILITLLTLIMILTSCVTTRVVNEQSVSFDADGNVISTYTYAKTSTKTSVDHTSTVKGFVDGVMDIGTDDDYVYNPGQLAYDRYDENTFSEKADYKWKDDNTVNVKSITRTNTKVGNVKYKKSRAEKAHSAGRKSARSIFCWIWEHVPFCF